MKTLAEIKIGETFKVADIEFIKFADENGQVVAFNKKEKPVKRFLKAHDKILIKKVKAEKYLGFFSFVRVFLEGLERVLSKVFCLFWKLISGLSGLFSRVGVRDKK